jgi:pimeloyl-ACP methyl ester carboxylesterase
VVAAAARLTPPPAAVVDLSGPDELSGVDAQAAAPRITAPILFVGATGDRYVAQMRRVAQAATHAAVNRVELVAGSNHGVALLDPALEPQAARLSAVILDFSRRNGG